MTIYMSEDRNRAIMADADGNIIAAKGLKNVLCCYADGLAETEELMPVNLKYDEYSEIKWDEQMEER